MARIEMRNGKYELCVTGGTLADYSADIAKVALDIAVDNTQFGTHASSGWKEAATGLFSGSGSIEHIMDTTVTKLKAIIESEVFTNLEAKFDFQFSIPDAAAGSFEYTGTMIITTVPLIGSDADAAGPMRSTSPFIVDGAVARAVIV